MDNVAIVRNKLQIRSDLMRCFLSEFTCTAFFLVKSPAIFANFIFYKMNNNQVNYDLIVQIDQYVQINQ